MSLYCPRCGEPWDMDCLHDRLDELHPGRPWRVPPHLAPPDCARLAKYSRDGLVTDQPRYERDYLHPLAADFRRRGCAALGARCELPQDTPNDRAMYARAAYDVLGDDMDAAAAMLDDLR